MVWVEISCCFITALSLFSSCLSASCLSVSCLCFLSLCFLSFCFLSLRDGQGDVEVREGEPLAGPGATIPTTWPAGDKARQGMQRRRIEGRIDGCVQTYRGKRRLDCEKRERVDSLKHKVPPPLSLLCISLTATAVHSGSPVFSTVL